MLIFLSMPPTQWAKKQVKWRGIESSTEPQSMHLTKTHVAMNMSQRLGRVRDIFTNTWRAKCRADFRELWTSSWFNSNSKMLRYMSSIQQAENHSFWSNGHWDTS